MSDIFLVETSCGVLGIVQSYTMCVEASLASYTTWKLETTV